MGILHIRPRLPIEIEEAIQIKGNILDAAVGKNAENNCPNAYLLCDGILIRKIGVFLLDDLAGFLDGGAQNIL